MGAVLDSKGLRISRTLIEYLRCDYSGRNLIVEPEVTISEEVIACTTKFRYLGSIIQSNGEIDEDVTHRIQMDELKWRAETRVLCDRKSPSRLKSKLYRGAIRPSLLYKTEYWSAEKTFKHKMEVTKCVS